MGFDTNTEKLGAHEVAAWLRRHPGFLQQFPDLALTLVVPRENGPAASLASYQLEVLRDKNRELARRLAELSANAQANERLAVRTHQLTLALMRQATPADTLRAMAASLAEDFSGDLVRIVVFAPVDGLDDADWLRVVAHDDAALAPFRDALRGALYETLFHARTTPDLIGSVVLVGGSSLMALVEAEARAVCPAARVERSEVFTAVVDGLAIASATAGR